jgi:molybdopterin-guanine dinucleotide biosynthesis protein A
MNLANHMLECLGDYDSVVPEIDSYLQPLAAVYSQKALPVFTRCLESNRLKLTRVFEELNTRILPEATLEAFGPIREQFFNVNDPEALSKANQMAGRYLL